MSSGSIEDELVKKAKAGDTRAMEILLVLLEPRIRGYIRKRWPEQLYEQAQVSDIVQDTHKGAWESMHQFRAVDLAEFKAWLFAIARNRMSYIVRHYAAERRRGKRVQLPDDSDTTAVRMAERFARSRKSPGSLAAIREAVPLLRDAIRLMPDEWQTVLRLHFHDGLTFPQIGARLAKKTDAVRQVAHRAVVFLRTVFENDRHGVQGSVSSMRGPEQGR